MRPLQKEIIAQLRVSPEIDPNAEIQRTLEFLKAYLYRYPFLRCYVLGISGGQDSTLVGRLAQLAIEEMRAETGQSDYQFIALRLPHGFQQDESDAQMALDFIQADQVYDLNIQAATQAIATELCQARLLISDFNKGNVKARMRMILQYAVAGHFDGAVLGTDHAAESVTGFYTKFGDGAADLMPLWRLTKEQGRQVLRALDCPAELYEKVPTADLEEDRPMLADEVALGVSYDTIDSYLTGQEVTEAEALRIEHLYLQSQHKRHLPITIFDDFWKE